MARVAAPILVLSGIVAGAISCAGEPGVERETPQPYGDFSKMGAGFYGPGREETAPLPAEGVKIGLTAPEKTPEGQEFRLAATLAVEERNAQGGYQGKPFVLVYRPDDGPWGVATKQVVALAFDEQSWAILGGFDGTRAHLAELVAAKAWVPVITPLASDLSIDYANVPWMFRIMPSDGAQANALFAHAARRGFRRVAAFVEGERDSIIAGKRVEEAAKKHNVSLVSLVQISAGEPERDLDRLDDSAGDALLLWGREETSLRFLRGLRARGREIPVLSPESLGTPRVLAEANALGDLTISAPYDLSREGPGLGDFSRRFEARAGRRPGPIAVSSYDAARLLLDAVDRAGLSRARIRDELAKAEFNGLSGEIRFNELGGNKREPILLRLEKGKWARVP